MDNADYEAGRRVTCPVHVLWGRMSHTQAVFDDVLPVWGNYVTGPLSGRAVRSGHYLAEHAPEEVLSELQPFFTA
jgi:haloacetate dehalogenase